MRSITLVASNALHFEDHCARAHAPKRGILHNPARANTPRDGARFLLTRRGSPPLWQMIPDENEANGVIAAVNERPVPMTLVDRVDNQERPEDRVSCAQSLILKWAKFSVSTWNSAFPAARSSLPALDDRRIIVQHPMAEVEP